MQYSHPELGLTWGPDPELTKLGIAQAEAVQKCWRAQAPLGAPISKDEMKWYVSPLTRTAQTMLHSWGDLLAGTPEVWEDWREVYGSHTCDKRRSRVSAADRTAASGSRAEPKTYIAERFPTFKIDESVTEEDELWKEDIRETDQMMQVRGQRALDRVFSKGGAEETCECDARSGPGKPLSQIALTSRHLRHGALGQPAEPPRRAEPPALPARHW
jgi:broad specificity phosphatase PhoE